MLKIEAIVRSSKLQDIQETLAKKWNSNFFNISSADDRNAQSS